MMSNNAMFCDVPVEYTLSEDFDISKCSRKNGIVTGASGGIGKAISLRLASMGYSLFLQGHSNMPELMKLKSYLEKQYPKQRFIAVSKDLTKSGAGYQLVRLASDTMGKLSFMVYCAGMAQYGMLNDLTDEEYGNLQKIHLENPLFASKAILPDLLTAHEGRVVFVSSIWGISGASCEVAYSALKAGMIGLTKSLAKEWAPSGITVNCVAPGMIDTKMNSIFSSHEQEEIVMEIPVGRIGRPEEIAEAVAYFFSPLAGFTTGQILSPNGGWIT